MHYEINVTTDNKYTCLVNDSKGMHLLESTKGNELFDTFEVKSTYFIGSYMDPKFTHTYMYDLNGKKYFYTRLPRGSTKPDIELFL